MKDPQNQPPQAPAFVPEGLPPGANTDFVRQKWQNMDYAHQSSTQALDIYLPNEGSGPFPVIINIHGGGFFMGDKADHMFQPYLHALKRGYALIGANYRLSQEALYPAAIHDIKAAIRWVKAHAAQYRLDAGKIALWGGSAGGYLAALAGTSVGVSHLEDLSMGNPEQSTQVQAVVDFFGPINFIKMDEQLMANGTPSKIPYISGESHESRFFGQALSEIPEIVRASCPETYISPDTPPFFFQHRTGDFLIPVQQTLEFSEKIKKTIGADKVEVVLIEGRGHGDFQAEDKQFSTEACIDRVLDFLDRYLK